MLNKYQANSLISASNINSGLLTEHFVNSLTSFNEFRNISRGLPILIPADPSIFDFTTADTFHVSDNELLDMYFGKRDKNYTGFQHSFETNTFLKKINILPQALNFYTEITKANEISVRQINELKSKFNTLSAFQTRNIPHFGHEAIIKTLLKESDHVVINPVIGPKKLGDLKLEGLQKIYDFIANEKYNNKISFIPIRAQMFYAGPREAIHHAIIRGKLGFDLFTVGRDHAGADGFFHSDAALKAIKQVKHQLQINILAHSGAVFCKGCNKGVLVGTCCHEQDQMIDVSGSKFRECIRDGLFYEFADASLQMHLKQLSNRVFEE